LWLGLLDGWDGLVLAAVGGLYDWLKDAKLRDEASRAEPGFPGGRADSPE
jgi:hypothetical protein